MPSNRNDHTYKPIYEGTTRRKSWTAIDWSTGHIRVIWADSEEEAIAHAKDQGWTLEQERT
jgi:hypothetical protein